MVFKHTVMALLSKFRFIYPVYAAFISIHKQMLGTSILTGLILLQAVGFALDPQSVLTNPERTATVSEYCKVARQHLVLPSDISTSQTFGSVVNLSFGIDP